jgi:hypothetical protein
LKTLQRFGETWLVLDDGSRVRAGRDFGAGELLRLAGTPVSPLYLRYLKVR